jgi:hypothetical protein
MSTYTRREFLETSSAGLAGAGLSGAVSPESSAGASVPPSDRLRFGVIGVNGMEWAISKLTKRLTG